MARAREARTSFPAELTSAGAARRFVGSTLREWSCDTVADNALLLVSELVTNAVLHARSRLELVVRLAGDRLRVEVHDESQLHPTRKQYSVHAGTGRGLMLVEQLAVQWGVDPIAGNGKRVWFELTPNAGGATTGDEDDVDLDQIERMLLGEDTGAFDVGGSRERGERGGGVGGSGQRALLLV